MFLGYLAKHADIYDDLKKQGYELIFKPTITLSNEPKGNCDAELVLHCTLEIQNFDRAIIASGDGDFHCLIRHLLSIGKLEKVIIPNKEKYSSLLKQLDPTNETVFEFLNDKKVMLSYNPSPKNKSPDSGRNPNGTFLP